MDIGCLLVVASLVSIIGSTLGVIFIARESEGALWPARWSALCLAISTSLMILMTWISERHEELEWFSGGIGQPIAFAMLLTFVVGLVCAVWSVRRAARDRTFSFSIALPWLMFLAFVVLKIYEAATM